MIGRCEVRRMGGRLSDGVDHIPTLDVGYVRMRQKVGNKRKMNTKKLR